MCVCVCVSVCVCVWCVCVCVCVCVCGVCVCVSVNPKFCPHKDGNIQNPYSLMGHFFGPHEETSFFKSYKLK